jgi:uncharacterized protein (DUF433 family)
LTFSLTSGLLFGRAAASGYNLFWEAIMDTEETALLNRIVSNPKVLGGKPVVRGTRIPVSLLLNFVANGMSSEEIRVEYPQLEDADIRAALVFAEKITC